MPCQYPHDIAKCYTTEIRKQIRKIRMLPLLHVASEVVYLAFHKSRDLHSAFQGLGYDAASIINDNRALESAEGKYG